MSEESNDGTMSGLVKTIIGTVGTIVTAGGAWLGSQMFGGGDQPAAQPAAAPVINIQNTQTQQQSAGGGKTVIIKEKAVGGNTQPAPAPKPKKKEGDEFKEEAPKW
jgi:hypothetical protein